jgi:hypothetical protein
MRRGRAAAGSTWASAWIDLLTLAALAKANQARARQRTLRKECLNGNGPLSAYNCWHANANRTAQDASASTLAAPRALDA